MEFKATDLKQRILRVTWTVLSNLSLAMVHVEARIFKQIQPRFWHKFIRGTIYNPPALVACLHKDTRVAYVSIPKVACTSLRRAFLQDESDRARLDKEKREHMQSIGFAEERLLDNFFSTDDIDSSLFPWRGFYTGPDVLISKISHVMGLTKHKGEYLISGYDKDLQIGSEVVTVPQINSYFVFTFVRNPFIRIISCYRDKYNVSPDNDDRLTFSYKIFPYINSVKSFSDFVARVCKTPYIYLDRHFTPQFLFLEDFKKEGGEVDFIGKLEDIQRDFEPIRKKYNLLPLEHMNTSKSNLRNKSWRDYYTPKTATLIYEKYRRDFEDFGYEEEYRNLLDYLEKKATSTMNTLHPVQNK